MQDTLLTKDTSLVESTEAWNFSRHFPTDRVCYIRKIAIESVKVTGICRVWYGAYNAEGAVLYIDPDYELLLNIMWRNKYLVYFVH
jgi:hypothetical protein